MTQPRDRIFCAIDTPDISAALTLAKQVSPHVGGLKLGMEFFYAQGPDGVRRVIEAAQKPLFLDLKSHDIPNTVAACVRSIVPLRPAFINVHAAGGFTMMEHAMEAVAEESLKHGVPRPKLLAVTVLTSLNEQDLQSVGQDQNIASQVSRLALLAQKAGLDGVVCSPQEIEIVRQACGPQFLLMVPGVRPAGAASQDQKRVLTPGEAIKRGADFLVIGRPITQAADPAQAAQTITAELN